MGTLAEGGLQLDTDGFVRLVSLFQPVAGLCAE
jgi:hypothetical protein